MLKTFLLILVATAAVRAEDAWEKVGELKTGVELRIYKKGSMQPILAKMDEANADRLVVVVKNEQIAIPKEQIDRIDYRPVKAGSKASKQTTSETKDNSSEMAKPGPPGGSTGPTTTTTTTYTMAGKPEYETIYRRPTLRGKQ